MLGSCWPGSLVLHSTGFGYGTTLFGVVVITDSAITMKMLIQKQYCERSEQKKICLYLQLWHFGGALVANEVKKFKWICCWGQDGSLGEIAPCAPSWLRHVVLYHRQRGSDCTVLTATGLVNGEWQILTPYRIETPKPIDKKFCTRHYVHQTTPYTKFGANWSTGASGQIGEI